MSAPPRAARHAAPTARRRRFGRALGERFFDRATAEVARDLLGAVLESTVDGVTVRGRIVEVEAYLGPHDPACHAAVGCTPRNRHLHGPPGTAYVYRIYGMHWCVNAVTREAGHGSAVLVRALEPLDGEAIMRQRRGFGTTREVANARREDRELANGPGKLCAALAITGSLDGSGLQRGALRLLAGDRVPDDNVIVTPRIGISKAADWPLRFVVAGSAHASRTPSALPRYTLASARAWCVTRGLA